MQININDLIRYGFCDPGGSHKTLKNKGTLARSAIVIIGVDPILNRIFTLDVWAKRTTTDDLIDTILKKHDQWKPKVFGCEANAMQVHLANAINREARFRNLRAVLLPVNQPTKVDKDWRIETVINSVLPHGRLFVMEDQVELIAEMRGFPTAQTKDIVDALASAIMLLPQRSAKRKANEQELALARYLQNSGASVEYTSERVAAVRYEQRKKALKELHAGKI